MIPVGNKFSDKEYDHNRKHPREYESNHPLTTCNPKGSANLFHGKPAGNSAEALRCKASGIYIYLGVVDGGLALQILVVGHLAVDEFAVCGEVKELVYFLYRHFLTAWEDGDPGSKVSFAVLSVRFLRLLGALHWQMHGEFTLKDQEEYARLYSAEVEYSQENLDFLFDSLM